MQASPFHTFQKGRQNGMRTARTWYLMWKTADPYLFKVGHSVVSHFVIRYTFNPFQRETRGKNPVTRICLSVFEKQFSLVKSVTGYRIHFFKVHFRGVLLVTSRDFVADFLAVDLWQVKLSNGA